jgi:hypothetical protein
MSLVVPQQRSRSPTTLRPQRSEVEPCTLGTPAVLARNSSSAPQLCSHPISISHISCNLQPSAEQQRSYLSETTSALNDFGSTHDGNLLTTTFSTSFVSRSQHRTAAPATSVLAKWFGPSPSTVGNVASCSSGKKKSSPAKHQWSQTLPIRRHPQMHQSVIRRNLNSDGSSFAARNFLRLRHVARLQLLSPPLVQSA